MEAAAKSNLKKVSLELGGKSPHLIFESAAILNKRRTGRYLVLPGIRDRTALLDLAFMSKTRFMINSWSRWLLKLISLLLVLECRRTPQEGLWCLRDNTTE